MLIYLHTKSFIRMLQYRTLHLTHSTSAFCSALLILKLQLPSFHTTRGPVREISHHCLVREELLHVCVSESHLVHVMEVARQRLDPDKALVHVVEAVLFVALFLLADILGLRTKINQMKM